MQTHPQSTPVNAQGRRLVRAPVNGALYLVTSVVVLMAFLALSISWIASLPVAILMIGAYKYFFPTEWLYDPVPEQSSFPESEINLTLLQRS